MKKAFGAFISIIVILFIAGGFTAVFMGLETIGQTLVSFFPFFAPIVVQTFEDYFTSKYFIVSIILAILSSLGIYLSVKEKKALYLFVSIVVDVVSIISIISNLCSCS